MSYNSEEIYVSCIMPVCDSERYVEMTIASLCQQTEKKIEIICVDDASKDKSLILLEMLALQDSRIRIVRNMKRVGAALSRNIGLREARGKYVIFLDSDDYFYPNMLETSYKLAIEQDADLVVLGYEQVFVEIENGREKEGKKTYIKNKSKIYCEETKDREYLEMLRFVPWNKLVRCEFLMQHGIEFQDIPTNNDMFYAMAVGMMAKRIVICDKVLLKYFAGRMGSLTKSRRNVCAYMPEAWNKLVMFLSKKGIEYDNKDLYNLIIDDMIAFYRDSYTSRECKIATTDLFYKCKELISMLIQMNRDGKACLHIKEFLARIQNREHLWDIRYYEYYIPSIKKLVENSHQDYKKIALWGCGVIGIELLEGMKLNQIKVDYVIDSDESKIGTQIEGYLIEKYEEVKEQIDVILVTTTQYFAEIKEIAVGKQVIDLRMC